MHNRQSGAAHVPMIFFLLLLAMFLGAASFAFVTHSDNGKLKKDAEDAKREYKLLADRNKLVKDYIREIGDVVKKQGAYTGRAGVDYAGANLAEFELVMNPAEVKKVMEDALGKFSLSASGGLEAALGALTTKIEQQDKRIKDIESSFNTTTEEKAKLDKAFKDVSDAATSSASAYTADLDKARTAYDAAKQEQETRINAVNEGLRTKNEELQAEKERAAKKEKRG